jgi:hypothetical protein
MITRYRIPFKRKIIVDDHWEIPFLGGTLNLSERDGYVDAVVVTFKGQSVENAPTIDYHESGHFRATIVEHDTLVQKVINRLENAASFIECVCDVDLEFGEVEIEYEGESLEEIARINLSRISSSWADRVVPLRFDIITRAIICSESSAGPRFEVTLLKSARKAIEDEQFIDSFRYSFLLIEALFGAGQFKKESLQLALKSNQYFMGVVAGALKSIRIRKSGRLSLTDMLLLRNSEVKDVVDHLVERRGFYFHGNVKRKDSWMPHKQEEAEGLAQLTMYIASQIAFDASRRMYDAKFVIQHFEDAMRVGAKIMVKLIYRFRRPGETTDSQFDVNLRLPGTKMTPSKKLEIAKKALDIFEEHEPVSELIEITCVDSSDGRKALVISFDEKQANN